MRLFAVALIVWSAGELMVKRLFDLLPLFFSIDFKADGDTGRLTDFVPLRAGRRDDGYCFVVE